MTTIKTIRRAKWHRKTDRWQATDEDGTTASFFGRPRNIYCLRIWLCRAGAQIGCRIGPKRKPPANHTTTLRRIRPAKKDVK